MNIVMRNGRKIWIFLSLLLVMVIFVILDMIVGEMSASASASMGEIFYSTCGVPTIDGDVSVLEWSGAASMTVEMISPGLAPPFTATVQVMNSANNLYMGLTINDDEFTPQGQYLSEGDTFLLIFNNDNSGSLYEVGNHVVALSAGIPQYEDRYIYTLPTSNQEDILGGGTADGEGLTSRLNDLNHFEMKFPLCSGDSLDFCLEPSDIVGFRLEYLDAQADGSFGGSQYFPGTTDISEADIVIGACQDTADIFIYLPLTMK